MNSNGVETIKLKDRGSIYFDHNQDDFAEASAWVSGEADGILILGNETSKYVRSGSDAFVDATGNLRGFDMLVEYDSNRDGKLTNEDKIWPYLHIIKNPVEKFIGLKADKPNVGKPVKYTYSLNELGITTIYLQYNRVSLDLPTGNAIEQIGVFERNGKQESIYAVRLEVDLMNSYYTRDFKLDRRVFFLPQIRSLGLLPSLTNAMSNDYADDGNLLDKVTVFHALSFNDILDPSDNARHMVKEIMFRWAQSEYLEPGSRGPYIDQRELHFLEKITGEKFRQLGMRSNPLYYAAGDLRISFNKAWDTYYAHLAIQGAAQNIIINPEKYSFEKKITRKMVRFDPSVLHDLITYSQSFNDTEDRKKFWANFMRIVNVVFSENKNAHKQAKELTAFAIHKSDPLLSMQDVEIYLDLMPPIPTFPEGTPVVCD